MAETRAAVPLLVPASCAAAEKRAFMVRLAAFLGPQTGQNPCWSLWERWYNNWAIFGDWLPRRIQENMEHVRHLLVFSGEACMDI